MKFFCILLGTTGFKNGISRTLREIDTTRPLSMDIPSMHSYIFLKSRSLRFLRSSGMILSLPAVPIETMY